MECPGAPSGPYALCHPFPPTSDAPACSSQMLNLKKKKKKKNDCHKTKIDFHYVCLHTISQYLTITKPYLLLILYQKRVKIDGNTIEGLKVEVKRRLWPWPTGYARYARSYLSAMLHVVAVTVTPASFLFHRRHPTLIGNNARKQILWRACPQNAWESGAFARRVIYHLPSGQSRESSRAAPHSLINPTRTRLSVYWRYFKEQTNDVSFFKIYFAFVF